MKYLIIVLFLAACQQTKNQKLDNDPLAARFSMIESKLNEFAVKHHATASTTLAHLTYHDPYDTSTYPLKRIVWSDHHIGKGILIQPYQDIRGIDSTAWDFTLLAWLDNGEPGGKPGFEKKLLSKVSFDMIEKNISQLLVDADKMLEELQPGDLK